MCIRMCKHELQGKLHIALHYAHQRTDDTDTLNLHLHACMQFRIGYCVTLRAPACTHTHVYMCVHALTQPHLHACVWLGRTY